MAVFSRPYQSEDDYAALRRFLVNLPGMRISAGNCTIGDLDWWRFHHDDPDYMQNVQLWLDGGEVVGWVWPEKSDGDLFVHPTYRQIEGEMIDWLIASARSRGEAELTIVANDRDRLRQQALAERGFVRTDAHYTYRGRSLEWSIPVPVLPDGFRFGDSVGVDDAYVEARVNVHRAAWEPSRMTVAKHRAVMQAPTYQPDLDLVVIGPGEAFATCTIVWFDEQNRIGVFEPVGCHPAFRRRGLTRTMMFEGMRRLQKLGAERAFVNSWHESLPANRLYESCGFQLIDRQRKWTRQL
jgi:ribosomal protein S18 acetylase RimI-like enzyme